MHTLRIEASLWQSCVGVCHTEVYGSCLHPPVANGDTGEKPLFYTQTLASESKALRSDTS